MNIILKNITKQFDNTFVLEQFNLELSEGRITCLMGPSGSGKTTLLFRRTVYVKESVRYRI